MREWRSAGDLQLGVGVGEQDSAADGAQRAAWLALQHQLSAVGSRIENSARRPRRQAEGLRQAEAI